jgi:hypothetical protein
MLVTVKLGADFWRGVQVRGSATYLPTFRDPPPTASRFANCSVPALRQVDHGSLHPSGLLLSVSSTNRLMGLG